MPIIIILLVFVFNTNIFASQIVTVKHDNTKEEILDVIKKYPHSGFDYDHETQFDQIPKMTAPYDAGYVTKECLDDALNAIKVVRYLAGVPYEHIKLNDELNNISQHGAVLLAASNQFSHDPSKPYDVSDEFFDIAYRGCSEANIFSGVRNLAHAVIGFVFDRGQNNIARAGHRRWILKPGAENFGMGYANGDNAGYGGERINMHVFDGLNYWECDSDSYIAWPSAGDFPIQYFAGEKNISGAISAPWSINLGAQYNEPSKQKVVLKLIRKRDNKVWIFDHNTPNLENIGLDNDKMHLSIDNDGYGMSKAIIFRPDMNALGEIKDGDIFTVELFGIEYTNGKSASLTYDINFFDLAKAMDNKIVLKIGNCEATVFGNKAYSDVAPIIANNRTMLPARFIAENLGADVLWDETEQKVTIVYRSKHIEMFINSEIAYVNGECVILDSPAFIQNGRTYTPVRFIAENLDAEVFWNEDTSEVIISAN